MPPCVTDIVEGSGDNNSGETTPALDGSIDERFTAACRQYILQYQEVQKKYHEIIYGTAEKALQNSQESQMKQLKASLERVNNEIMHQLKEARKVEVKNLALVHKDKDELVRWVSTIELTSGNANLFINVYVYV